MTSYLFIESRDPFESADSAFIVETAAALKQRDSEVVVFLVQNGVLAVRQNARSPQLSLLVEAGITLLADDFSLAERGILASEIIPAVQQASIDSLVDLLVRGNTKAIWH
jgi:sulfur relay (sulfurtransferase) DsrF/TusC family protein